MHEYLLELTHWGRGKMTAIIKTFLDKRLNLNCNFIDVCYGGSNEETVVIDSGNGLAPNRRLTVIWTNGGLVCERVTRFQWVKEYTREEKNYLYGEHATKDQRRCW